MSNSPDLYSDPDILPAFSPVPREHIGNCGIPYNAGGTNIVDFGLTWMLPKDRIVLIHMRILEEGLSLFAIDQGKAGINTLSHRIRSRPIIPKGEGWKKQQDWQVSHNTRSLSGNTRIVK